MIFSPSSREEYCFCPRKWWLRKHGVVTRTIGYPELCAMGGNAVGKAMEVWNTNLITGQKSEWGKLLSVALQEYNESLRRQLESGRYLSQVRAREFSAELPELITKAVEVMWVSDPLKKYAILAAEQSFAQAGGARLDVLVKDATGKMIVFDYKCKFGELEEKWMLKAFDGYEQGEQRFTYTTLTQAVEFGIIMIVVKPRREGVKLKSRVEVRTWPVTDAQRRTWLRDAQLLTPGMERTLLLTDPRQVPGKTYPHADSFGPCPYQTACLDYELDERMQLDYVTITKETV